MRKPEKMLIYNVFPLLAGPLGGWGEHFKRAKDMGFNWIFVNPIHEPGLSGSIYSIKDYFSINPLLLEPGSGKAPAEQARAAFMEAEGLGLRTMVDLVINHCAIDAPLIKEHPEWFKWEGGKVAHPFCMDGGKKVVWGDLARFDYEHTRDKEGLFEYMSGVVEFLLSLGIRGFRADAAYQLPGSFWRRLIRETKRKHPDVVFFAETLGCSSDQTAKTAAAGFDYIFNSSKWWDFKSPWLLEQYSLTREVAPSIGFPESHDTRRLAEEYGGNSAALKQRYLFSALFSSGVMMLMGYEFGFRVKPHVVSTRPGDRERTGIDLTEFIKQVNLIKQNHSVFQEEAPTGFLHNGNPDVLIMWKAAVYSKEEALIIINKDVNNRQRFRAESLHKYVQSGKALMDVSPEGMLDYIPEPFNYDLRPGQGIVFVTERNGR